MNNFIILRALSVALVLSVQIAIQAQGLLVPPGLPGPTFKTLQQIEPRTPISSLPFTIDQPGSYYLTTNLMATPGVTIGITIAAHDVSLDLNGFALVGAPGSQNGIATSGARTNIAIRNGTVRSWPRNGVFLGAAQGGILEKLRALKNGSFSTDAGILAETGFRVMDSVANDNTGDGIRVLRHASISGCTATGNGQDGISVRNGGTVHGCTAADNGTGIFVGSGGTLSDCTAESNKFNGIVVTTGSTVSGCTARGNDGDGVSAFAGSTIRNCTVTGNTGDGIEVSDDCHVEDNTCAYNGYLTNDGAGIRVTGQKNRIDSNLTADNDRGIHVTAIRNFVVRNSARMNGSNYVIVAGNRIAQIVQPTVNAADIPHANTGNTNGFTGVDPWANFSH